MGGWGARSGSSACRPALDSVQAAPVELGSLMRLRGWGSPRDGAAEANPGSPTVSRQGTVLGTSESLSSPLDGTSLRAGHGCQFPRAPRTGTARAVNTCVHTERLPSLCLAHTGPPATFQAAGEEGCHPSQRGTRGTGTGTHQLQVLGFVDALRPRSGLEAWRVCGKSCPWTADRCLRVPARECQSDAGSAPRRPQSCDRQRTGRAACQQRPLNNRE